MDRRALLTAAGSILIAGCNSSDSGSTPTETATATQTPTPAPAAYDVSLEAPERASVEERFIVTVEITNTGEQSGDIYEPIDIRIGGDSTGPVEYFEENVPPADTVSTTVSVGPINEAGEATLEIPDYDAEATIEIHADDVAPVIERVNFISDWEEYGDVVTNSIDEVQSGEDVFLGIRYEIWVHEGEKDSFVQAIIEQDGEQVVVEQDRRQRLVDYSDRTDWEDALGFRTDDWEPGTHTAEVIVRDEINGEVSDSFETTFEVI